jgi:hypothetical protein
MHDEDRGASGGLKEAFSRSEVVAGWLAQRNESV